MSKVTEGGREGGRGRGRREGGRGGGRNSQVGYIVLFKCFELA